MTDEALADDILNYMKPSLLCHQGCDIIDIYPSAGVWSRKLNDFLKPRSHILMEPEEVTYKPFLQPLLDRPGTVIVPKSGIIWAELEEVLSPAYLPHQKERDPTKPLDPPERNDTLLVTANLAFFPKKKFRTFDSLAQLVLYQFMNTLRASSLFQKYGMVRMLIWAAPDDIIPLLPRTVQERRRVAMEGEISTEWIMEIAGPDGLEAAVYHRDRRIDVQGTRDVLDKMRKQGVVIPPGRETRLASEVLAMGEDQVKELLGEDPRVSEPPAELVKLQKKFDRGKVDKLSDEGVRLKRLQTYELWKTRRSIQVHELLNKREAILKLHREMKDEAASDEEVQQMGRELNKAVLGLNRYLRQEYILARDNLHVFHQDPPVMSWDRRTVEPLVAKPQEFYPNVACSLIDIQPKAAHPLFRDMGPQSKTRSGDYFELILKNIISSSSYPLPRVFQMLHHGAPELLENCPSVRDPLQNGSPLDGTEGLNPRTLNEKQLIEILDAWMRWPFGPDYHEFVGRMLEENTEIPEDDTIGKSVRAMPEP
ncbi:hypothetical protein B0H67DRAFT_597996 [Lasiosphaeris hirsuta]|uniref:Mitochondrial transcription factor 1 n=1 Tax=Lasiosphaeris hirsuta TaxID=260670 RepID=A0AA40AYG6_9PEZI|nr:hypothetical protein B0H67DRAFT_597996 [Lasiosphaeris hirsuta]